MLIYTPYKLAIAALIAGLIFAYLGRYIVDHISSRNKHLTIICGTPFVLTVVSFVSAVYFVLGATHQVPLSELPNSVTVEDNVVTIHDLPTGYWYNARSLGGDDPIKFRYSYDEEFKTGILETVKGDRYELSDEDSDYIKSRQKG